MSHLNQRRTLPAAARPHALRAVCPHASATSRGSTRARSQWLQVTCALACQCTARFREWLILFGSAGIAGFCAAGLGFFAGWLSESQYLAWVACSVGLFAVSVLVAHLGDPYELQRSECQRTSGSPMSAPSRTRAISRPVSSSESSAAMN